MLRQPVSRDEQVDVLALRAYLGTLVSELRGVVPGDREDIETPALPERIFGVLTNRQFCYLSKTRVAGYQNDVFSNVESAVKRWEAVRFYYDIGGGYHASIQPGEEDLSFDVGLAELFVLKQVKDFASRVERLYVPGVKFSLVIDNLCALLVNDIPIENTLGYCRRLRELIRELKLDAVVDLVVESEHVSVTEFSELEQDLPSGADSGALTDKQHENVERFLGRRCVPEEASERTRRYRAVVAASERLLAPMIRGVHMTQRATRDTICFRPFPGGDSRIQCGEVALTLNSRQVLCPVLLTSSNSAEYAVQRHCFCDILPGGIRHVTYAARLGG